MPDSARHAMADDSDTLLATACDVSVVMLTREAGPRLRESLESVGWAREVIALDAGSCDGTSELLGAYGALVLPQDGDLVRAHEGNFDVARNAGLERARGRWVLVLDADEVVTDGLRDEILAVAARPAQVAYEIPRVNLYWGRPSRVLGEDRQLRLFPRGAARYEGTQLDQPPRVDCPVERLKEPLHHYQRHLLRTLRERTDQRARRMARRGEITDASCASLFWHHLRWYTFQQKAWREGPRGLALAALYAAYPALAAIKARRLACADRHGESAGVSVRAEAVSGEATARVSVVVVTYRSETEIAGCLDSVRAVACEMPLDVVVVDNASDDGTVRTVRRDYPEVTVRIHDRNLGFASGCNAGIAMTTGEFVLLLNPDARLQPGTVSGLVGYLDTHSEVGIVGPALESPSGQLQPDISATGLFPSFIQALFEYTRLKHRWPNSRWVRDYFLAGLDRRSVRRVAMVQGACFLVRREVLRTVGAFDERFFLYFEETDLCKRAADAGWQTHYVGSVAATHTGAGSSDNRRPLAREFVRSLYSFHRKHHGRLEAACLWAILAPYHLIETVRLSVASRRHAGDPRLRSDRQAIAERSVAHFQMLLPRVRRAREPMNGPKRVRAPQGEREGARPPVVIEIAPPGRWIKLEIGEIWQFRELLLTFVVRELRLRYAQTWVGAAWVLLKPVSTMALLWAVFGVVAALPTDGVPYALFCFSGLVLWFFFAGAVTDSQESLVGNAELLRKVYFPRPLLPIATVTARLVDLAIMLAFLAAMLVYHRVERMPDITAMAALTLLTAMLATGVGMAVAAVNVRFRDAQHVVPVALQLLLFASPVIYSSRMVPPEWRRAYMLNPLAGLIEGFRSAVLGRPLPTEAVLISATITVALLTGAFLMFRRMETGFADHV